MAEMTDDVFLGYCRIHCETERGLFSKAHVARLIMMAGSPADHASPAQILTHRKEWYSLGPDDVLPLVELAAAAVKG